MNPLGDDRALAARIEQYLTTQAGRPVTVGTIRRFPVGFSWLTFAVPISGLEGEETRELILRLGPADGLFAPYSATPQVQAMRTFAPSDVPVPRAYWHSDDPAILGAPFLFCEKAEGHAIVPWVPASEPPLEEGYRKRVGTQFIDALAALHRLDWRDQPIAAMATTATTADGTITPENAAHHAVQAYKRLIDRWAMRPYPLAEWGIRWLEQHCPVAPRVTVVHGDYRTGNFLEHDGRISAILDGELVHLGDPHEDLAWVSMPMYKGGSPYLCRLCEPEWFYERWAAQSGIAVNMASVRYYQVFSLLKLAATHMAAARCFEEGRFNDLRMPAMGSQVATCLRQMDKLIESA
ncbi:MAG: phosphotransferase family protein [Burkholderiaceae bacterium]|nr:phosphotransferase family protein [Burkholderiaceae bacterium]